MDPSSILAEERPCAGGRRIALIVDTDAPPVRMGIAALEAALRGRGFEPYRSSSLEASGDPAFVVGGVGSRTVEGLLARRGMSVPEALQSLCIVRVRTRPRPVVVLVGRDARGLMYALLEAAEAIEHAPAKADPISAVSEVIKSPYMAVRGVSIQMHSAELDGEWFFDPEFWCRYFDLLSRSRFNTFALVFAHQTSYLAPPYPFFVEVEEFPEVRPKGLSDGQCERNLETLRRISSMAQEYGIDFVLGVWQQAPKYGESMVEGLSPENNRDYCAAALKRLLQECPTIGGVQFRLNVEAAVDEEVQKDFFEAQFRAIRDCGREVKLDLRFKGLREETIRAAVEMGFRPTVSTKFWAEHMGLPYHPAEIDPRARYGRYSYGDMLRRPREYDVIYRLWSAGSQRVLLWGDPEYVRRFVAACRSLDGIGFEVNAPLTCKGHGNRPGRWRIYADKSYEYYEYEQEKFWLFYLLFGRLGYNPETPAEVWRREFSARFGAAAEDMEEACFQTSRIVPLITAFYTSFEHASLWNTWIEMSPSDPLDKLIANRPTDNAMFYSIRDYIADAVGGQLQGKCTPIRVSRLLKGYSERALRALSRAEVAVAAVGPEFRATAVDIRVLARLAVYWAETIGCGVHYAFFKATGEPGRIRRALRSAKNALAAWEKIVRLTEGVYYPKMNFGLKGFGHWKDGLPLVRQNIEFLAEEHKDEEGEVRTYPGEMELSSLPPWSTLRSGVRRPGPIL